MPKPGIRYSSGASQSAVKFTGPFFQRDPSLSFVLNVQAMLEAVAKEGQEAVQSLYPVGPTGHGKAGVYGRTKSLTGKKWYAVAVISQTHVYPWPAGGAKQYRGGKTEAKHHMFRTVTQQLRASRAVLHANLTKGIE